MFQHKTVMAKGTRKGRERQEEIWCRSEVAEAPGHPFYRKLEAKLKEAGFDRFCEEECKRHYADGVGRPSLVPGPADPEAEITKLQDGRTALAYKVEQAVTWRREPSLP
jgi:hypothetical protein